MKLLDESFIRKLDMLSIVSRKVIVGRIRGEKRSKRRGVSSEFAEHRDYSPGDDTRFIDWNIYGRLNRLFLKLFYEEEDLHVSILIDASRSMDYGSPNKFDYARRLAAALGYIAAAGLDRVSLRAFSEDVDERLAPFRGKRQVWRMFSFLENLRCSGATSMQDACRRAALQARGKGITIIISPGAARMSSHSTCSAARNSNRNSPATSSCSTAKRATRPRSAFLPPSSRHTRRPSAASAAA